MAKKNAKKTKPKPKLVRSIYPLEITWNEADIAEAKRATGISKKSVLLRLAITRGLAVLKAQLAAPVEVAA